MKLSELVSNMQKVLETRGDQEISRVFQTDFGDEMVLEGPGPEYVRLYVPFPLDEDEA